MLERYEITGPRGGKRFASTKGQVASIVSADEYECREIDQRLGRSGDGCYVRAMRGGTYTIYRVR